MTLKEEIQALEAYKNQRELKDDSVSSATVGWHLYHSLLVIKSILASLKYSDPTQFVETENKARDYVLTKKAIKRGIAQSPARVTPPQDISDVDLEVLFKGVEKGISTIDQLPDDSYFDHHNLGHLKKREAIEFLSVHTQHHLQIIKDIVT